MTGDYQSNLVNVSQLYVNYTYLHDNHKSRVYIFLTMISTISLKAVNIIVLSLLITSVTYTYRCFYDTHTTYAII